MSLIANIAPLAAAIVAGAFGYGYVRWLHRKSKTATAPEPNRQRSFFDEAFAPPARRWDPAERGTANITVHVNKARLNTR